MAMQAEAESLEPREDICTGHVQLHCPASGEESPEHTWKPLAHSCHGVDNTGLRDLNFVGTFCSISSWIFFPFCKSQYFTKDDFYSFGVPKL